MPLLRDIPPDQQVPIAAELARRQDALRQITEESGRRATTFLLVVLVGGAAATAATAIRFPGHSPLVIASLACFLVGFVLLGLLHAINTEAMWRLSFQFAAYRSGVLKSDIDTETLNASVKPTLTMKVPIFCGYGAFAFWFAGSVLCVTAIASGINATGGDSSRPRPVAPVVETQPGPPPVTVNPGPVANPVAPEPVHNTATSNAIAFADKIGVAAVVVGALQVVALFIAYGVMRRSARRQLRAYVFAESFNLIDGALAQPPQTHRAGFPGALLVIKNSGATPAFNVRSGAVIEVIEPINEDKLVLAPLMKSFGASLGPGVGLTNTPWYGRALTATEIADIATGAKAIYLHGRVEYEDAFRRKHFTTVRLRYAGQFPPSVPMPLIFAAQGNTAD